MNSVGTHPIESGSLLVLPESLRKRVLIDYLARKLDGYPSRSLVDDVHEFILSGRNGELSLPNGLSLTLSYGMVQVERIGTASDQGLPSGSVELKVPGRLQMPLAGITITTAWSTLAAPGKYPLGKAALLSKRCVTGSLWVRKRLPGDRFMPLGLKRDKKLKDFFVDRKVPRAMRDQVPLVLDDQGHILWVGGIEISQRAALDGVEGEEAILICIEDLDPTLSSRECP